jgi:hypothetical protein
LNTKKCPENGDPRAGATEILGRSWSHQWFGMRAALWRVGCTRIVPWERIVPAKNPRAGSGKLLTLEAFEFHFWKIKYRGIHLPRLQISHLPITMTSRSWGPSLQHIFLFPSVSIRTKCNEGWSHEEYTW